MKRLFLVRHGSYGDDDRLSDYGREQIAKLAEKIKPLLNGKKPIVLASPADRALESGEILAKAFGTNAESHEILWTCEGHGFQPDGIIELIKKRADDAEDIILISHKEIERFPQLFAKIYLDGAPGIYCLGIEKGNAVMINCEEKKIGYISCN